MINIQRIHPGLAKKATDISRIQIIWYIVGQRSFCFLLLLLISVNANGQNLSNEKFWYLTPDEGLSQSTVETIFQDSEGYMWFGTLEGLNRYEGQNKNVVVYKNAPSNPKSLSNDEVEFIYEDSRNNLWIGTDGGGLNLYDREADNFIVYSTTNVAEPHSGELSDNTIHTMMEDSRGNFWLGTFNGLNLMNRDEGTFKHYFADPEDKSSLSENYITSLFEDHQGDIWVGTLNGLNVFYPKSETFDQFYLNPAVNTVVNNVEVIFEDSQNRLWIGTQLGLYHFDRATKEFIAADFVFSNSNILNETSILSIIEDSQGVLWIGTENEGLFAVNIVNDEVQHFKFSANELHGLNNNSIYSLYESDDQILWIGTFDGGVNIMDRKQNKFQHYTHSPGKANTLNENSIYALLKDERGNFWIGTDGGGLNLFDEEKDQFTAIRHDPNNKNSLPSDVILDMVEDSQNRIWLGTYNGGLTCFNVKENTFRTYKFDSSDPNSLSNNQVFVVYEDREGDIWAGTNGGGINKLIDEEKGVFQRFMDSNTSATATSLPHNYIRAIYEDTKGNFWVGTYGGGMIKANSGKFSEYNAVNNRLNSNRVFSIYEDKQGTIWAGTKGGGIAYYDAEADRFISYTTSDGLPNNIINAILEDDHENLWISTNNGLSRFNPSTLSFKNFNLNDGVQSREFKPGAAFKSEEGFMYFGGINGFNKFHPDSIREKTEVSPVALTDFQIFNNSVPVGKDSPLKKHINQVERIELPHTASVITFKYSALNFNPDQGYTYAYKLEGFDNDWNYVNSQNTATYTNLDAGNYTFIVKAANSDGVWGAEDTKVQLVITPPFWETSWFYFLSVLFIAGLVFGGFKYRVRNITKQNKRLEQKVAKRTFELEESNQELNRALNDLKETRKELVQNAHKAGMADIASGVLHNIGNVLNSIITSTSITNDVLKRTKLEKLFQANQLLKDHQHDIEHFLTSDPKGKKLIEYYIRLEKSIKNELKTLRLHNNRLDQKASLINEVIAAQQSYATVGLNMESSNLEKVIDDTLTMLAASFERHNITIKKDIEQTAPISFQQTKLVHVLLNIFKNAKEAIVSSGSEEKVIAIRLYQKGDEVLMEISDNGHGIEEKNLNKIFTHGFTTKQDGHGFGLHSSANYLSEMGGKIQVSNSKEYSGATFTLFFAVSKKKSLKKMAADI